MARGHRLYHSHAGFGYSPVTCSSIAPHQHQPHYFQGLLSSRNTATKSRVSLNWWSCQSFDWRTQPKGSTLGLNSAGLSCSNYILPEHTASLFLYLLCNITNAGKFIRSPWSCMRTEASEDQCCILQWDSLFHIYSKLCKRHGLPGAESKLLSPALLTILKDTKYFKTINTFL